jgi:hypothetical protein
MTLVAVVVEVQQGRRGRHRRFPILRLLQNPLKLVALLRPN